MHADNIVKMLKDIRKTVRASTKLQPGSNAFAQFLDEVSIHVPTFPLRTCHVFKSIYARSGGYANLGDDPLNAAPESFTPSLFAFATKTSSDLA